MNINAAILEIGHFGGDGEVSATEVNRHTDVAFKHRGVAVIGLGWPVAGTRISDDKGIEQAAADNGFDAVGAPAGTAAHLQRVTQRAGKLQGDCGQRAICIFDLTGFSKHDCGRRVCHDGVPQALHRAHG